MAIDTSLLPGELVLKNEQEIKASDQIREIIGDVYTFVRSREINKSIANFSFDHYIEQAKQAIKGAGRALRDASGEQIGVRPTQLEALEKLERSFNDTFNAARQLAEKADK